MYNEKACTSRRSSVYHWVHWLPILFNASICIISFVFFQKQMFSKFFYSEMFLQSSPYSSCCHSLTNKRTSDFMPLELQVQNRRIVGVNQYKHILTLSFVGEGRPWSKELAVHKELTFYRMLHNWPPYNQHFDIWAYDKIHRLKRL